MMGVFLTRKILFKLKILVLAPQLYLIVRSIAMPAFKSMAVAFLLLVVKIYLLAVMDFTLKIAF